MALDKREFRGTFNKAPPQENNICGWSISSGSVIKKIDMVRPLVSNQTVENIRLYLVLESPKKSLSRLELGIPVNTPQSFTPKSPSSCIKNSLLQKNHTNRFD